MILHPLKAAFFLVFAIAQVSCTTLKKTAMATERANIKDLHFLGGYEVPDNFLYNNTTVGGLSGIDYDAMHNIFYLISDDRSAVNAARFYTATISISQHGIDSLKFKSVNYLLQPDGTVYPNNKKDRYKTPDPEAMRYNPVNSQLIWSSEGERIVKKSDTILENPAVNIVSLQGKFIDSFLLPANLMMQAVEKGPRQNGVFEGLTFADNYKTLLVNVEEPLYEDGPRAEVTDNNAYIRILKFDMGTKKNTAQFAYKLDKVAYPANPENGFKINGIPDILYTGNNKMLVIERSFSTGRAGCTIKVFNASLHGATDVKNLQLKNAAGRFKPITKNLLLNMDNLGIYIDNIEGVTFGPRLRNGNKTLIFVADNNFSKEQITQLLLFEVIE